MPRLVKLSSLDSPVSNSVSKSGIPKDGGAIASTSTIKGGLSGAMLPAESVTVYVILQVPLSNANPSPSSGASFPLASTQGTVKVSLVCSEDTNPEPTVVVVNPFLAKRVTWSFKKGCILLKIKLGFWELVILSVLLYPLSFSVIKSGAKKELLGSN